MTQTVSIQQLQHAAAAACAKRQPTVNPASTQAAAVLDDARLAHLALDAAWLSAHPDLASRDLAALAVVANHSVARDSDLRALVTALLAAKEAQRQQDERDRRLVANFRHF